MLIQTIVTAHCFSTAGLFFVFSKASEFSKASFWLDNIIEIRHLDCEIRVEELGQFISVSNVARFRHWAPAHNAQDGKID